MVKREVALAIAELFCIIDHTKNNLCNVPNNSARIHLCKVDFFLDVLFFIRQEVVGVTSTADVVLSHQPIQAAAQLFAHSNLFQTNVVCHQNHKVVQIGRHVLVDISNEIEKLQNIHIHRLQTIVIFYGFAAAINHIANRTVQKRMYSIIEAEQWHQCKLVLFFHFLGCFLETAQHGTLAAREVLTRIAVFADLHKNFLHDKELVRNKRKILCKLCRARESFDVRHCVGKAKQVSHPRVFLLIDCIQRFFCFWSFFQNALLDYFVYGRGRKAQTSFETSLDPREFICAYLDDLINSFLSGTDHPDFSSAFTADFFHQRLQIQQHIRVRANILTRFVHHKQKAEVCRFCADVCIDVVYKL